MSERTAQRRGGEGEHSLTADAIATLVSGTLVGSRDVTIRSVAPLDRATIADSVRKTGRVLVVDEAPAACGFSGEIFAVVCEECFDDLDAPPRRVCSLHVPNPFSPVLENQMIPTPARVASEVRSMLQ